MLTLVLTAWLQLLAQPAASAATNPPCTCAEAKTANVWCEVHDVGYLAGLPIKSKALFETLDAHGHELDLTTFTCPSCKDAIDTGGFCEEHRIGFVGRLAYFSRLTYELARGERSDPAKLTCATCKKNAAGRGWCAKHKVGRIGNVAIRDQAAFRRAEHAAEILDIAIATAPRCELCANAMLFDTECPVCRITYKDGKEISRRPGMTRPDPGGPGR